jgi:aminopeptidase N
MKHFSFLFIAFLLFYTAHAQEQTFTHQDTLRGSITTERVWWDLLHYDLEIKFDPDQKFISGKNTITYQVLKPYQVMQIDLQEPLQIEKITQNGKELKFKRDGNVFFIRLTEKQTKKNVGKLTVYYHGKPREAVKAPWDGGISWKKDKNGKPFIATSCQGLGSSVWWPCKDHMYDEPDRGMRISITPPEGLMDVSNGRLEKVTENKDGSKTYHWKVKNPINNYGVNANIAEYVHFSDIYKGEKGDLDCNYYVLPYNLEKAKKQFTQAHKMLEAFEYWFGPYPFYEDGYKLVEVPYLGMEHQSSVTYGNKFANGYLGSDLSHTGWGLKFDFIIIHESGHEWFANNITYKDIADMWIHEGFTSYSEVLYVDYHFGKEAGNEYMIGIMNNIKNDKPVIGPYNVNKEGSGDMYPKGAAVVHMIRQMVNNDEKFRDILRGMNKDFYHQTVTTRQIENYLIKRTGLKLKPFFDQYLRTTKVPIIEFKEENGEIKYRFNHIVEGFSIPVRIYIDGKEEWITPKKKWKKLKGVYDLSKIEVDKNYYLIRS